MKTPQMNPRKMRATHEHIAAHGYAQKQATNCQLKYAAEWFEGTGELDKAKVCRDELNKRTIQKSKING